MSEETPAETERPRPGANPARRARRIGGRPVPQESGSTTAPATDSAPSGGVALGKPARPAAQSGPDGRGRALPLAWFPALVLATALILLLGLLGWFSHGGYWDKPDAKSLTTPSSKEQETVLAAAKTCFATLNTYDYRKLDAALDKALECTTGTFTSDYRLSFTAQVAKYAPTLKAVQVAQVNKAAIESISPDGKQWAVLVFGQLQTASTSTKNGPRVSPAGAVLTMDQVGDSWLVAKVDVDTGTGLAP